MKKKQQQLFVSWVIALCSIYVAFSVSVMMAFFIAFLIVFFRDSAYEKKFAQTFMDRNSLLVGRAKQYVFIVSTGLFLYVVYSLALGEHKILSNYKLMGQLLLVVFLPFVLMLIAHEVSLFRSYGNKNQR